MLHLKSDLWWNFSDVTPGEICIPQLFRGLTVVIIPTLFRFRKKTVDSGDTSLEKWGNVTVWWRHWAVFKRKTVCAVALEQQRMWKSQRKLYIVIALVKHLPSLVWAFEVFNYYTPSRFSSDLEVLHDWSYRHLLFLFFFSSPPPTFYVDLRPCWICLSVIVVNRLCWDRAHLKPNFHIPAHT